MHWRHPIVCGIRLGRHPLPLHWRHGSLWLHLLSGHHHGRHILARLLGVSVAKMPHMGIGHGKLREMTIMIVVLIVSIGKTVSKWRHNILQTKSMEYFIPQKWFW